MFQLFPGLICNVAALGSATPLLDGSESDGTNLMTGGVETFSGWGTLNVSTTANAAVAPDGTTTAYQVLETSATDRHGIYTNSFTISAGASVTYSIYGKAITTQYLQLLIAGAGSTKIYAYFDLTNGTVTDSGTLSPDGSTAISSTSCQAGVNGFYKCTLVGIVDGTSTSPYFQPFCSDRSTHTGGMTADSPSYAGNTSNGTYLWRPKAV